MQQSVIGDTFPKPHLSNFTVRKMETSNFKIFQDFTTPMETLLQAFLLAVSTILPHFSMFVADVLPDS